MSALHLAARRHSLATTSRDTSSVNAQIRRAQMCHNKILMYQGLWNSFEIQQNDESFPYFPFLKNGQKTNSSGIRITRIRYTTASILDRLRLTSSMTCKHFGWHIWSNRWNPMHDVLLSSEIKQNSRMNPTTSHPTLLQNKTHWNDSLKDSDNIITASVRNRPSMCSMTTFLLK